MRKVRENDNEGTKVDIVSVTNDWNSHQADVARVLNEFEMINNQSVRYSY